VANLNVDDLHGVYSTSELRTMCEAGRKLFSSAADRLSVTAAELAVLLRRLPGNPVLLGLDSRATARAVTRHLVRAAALQTGAAHEMKATWFAYEQYILQPSSRGNGNGRTFTVNG
jgi:hypothetical protein